MFIYFTKIDKEIFIVIALNQIKKSIGEKKSY